MIPDLTESGYLPPGVHRTTLENVIAHFGSGSAQREAIVESLRWFLPVCVRAGIARLLIDGSFTTAATDPNDADCVLLQGAHFDPGSDAAHELEKGFPYLDLHIVGTEDYNFFATDIFATDRSNVPKGMLEVEI